MRIAFVADDLYPGYGGQAAATEGHIEALLALGHEVRVLAGDEASPTMPPTGVTVERLPVWRPGEKQTHVAFPEAGKIKALLDWADVVQINTPTPLALRTLRFARRKGVPSVIGFHTQEESATLHFRLLRPFVRAALRTWYGYLYQRPDRLVAPTDFAARLARRYTRRPIYVVSNGIHLPVRGTAERERAASMRRRLLSGRRYLLSYMGRLTHEKCPEDLLVIFSELRRLRTDVRLAVAGTGPLRKTLERQAAWLGLTDEIRFLGYVSGNEKQDLLAASDLFLMPSPTELQSIATLEAMAQGCAVVAADVETSAVGEMVQKADCGVCYRPESLEKAAVSISSLLGQPDELQRLQRNAERAARGHDVRESGRGLQEVYRDLTGLRSGSVERSGEPLERMGL